ncbi:MAG TPA: adenylosuccinate synthase [Thermoplasmatales archaeon]|nr:adenylosuccinate synthase [Thermoplasmatales archaeon]
MPVTLIVGTQWGDEGKGKIVDYYAEHTDYVVRFQGGSNAGHTIKVGEETYKLHLLPSGVVRGKIGIIGNGVVVDPEVLIKEIEMLEEREIKLNLLISDRANVVMPYHKLLDGAEESYLGSKKIGTTKRGIGPCYSDKVARRGIRIVDLLDKEVLRKKLEIILPVKQRLLDVYGIKHDLDIDELVKEYSEYGEKIRNFVTDASIELRRAIDGNKSILLEGAQGTMLDVDFGTYPYTTSSHTVAGGACIGCGISPKDIDEIIGVVKAYTTRVGGGPLPSELKDDVGRHLQEKGGEFGTTTGRARRCGWLDLVVVKHACLVSGVTKLAITKLDVLDGLKTLKVCTSYKCNDKMLSTFPAKTELLEKCEPVFVELDGWDHIDRDARSFDDLPENAQSYLKFIEKEVGIKIALVSIGPERNETIAL